MICPHCNQTFEHASEDLALRLKFREAQLLVRSRHDSKVLKRYRTWESRGRAIIEAEAAARRNHP